MKRISIPVLASTLALTVGLATAQDTKAPPASAGAQPACCMDSKAQMGQMDEHVQRMRALHDKMANASPEERQKLMAEQRQAMQQGMAMMQQMMQQGGMMSGATMGGAGMGGPGMGAGAKGAEKGQRAKPMEQKTQMQMMEKRMDMMQTMMQSMMDQQGASGNTMIPAPTK